MNQKRLDEILTNAKSGVIFDVEKIAREFKECGSDAIRFWRYFYNDVRLAFEQQSAFESAIEHQADLKKIAELGASWLNLLKSSQALEDILRERMKDVFEARLLKLDITKLKPRKPHGLSVGDVENDVKVNQEFFLIGFFIGLLNQKIKCQYIVGSRIATSYNLSEENVIPDDVIKDLHVRIRTKIEKNLIRFFMIDAKGEKMDLSEYHARLIERLESLVKPDAVDLYGEPYLE